MATAVHFNLGLSLKAADELAPALEAFEAVLGSMSKDDGRRGEVHQNAGDCAAKLGRWLAAAAHYEAVGAQDLTAQRNAASCLVNDGGPDALRRAAPLVRGLLRREERREGAWHLQALLLLALAGGGEAAKEEQHESWRAGIDALRGAVPRVAPLRPLRVLPKGR